VKARAAATGESQGVDGELIIPVHSGGVSRYAYAWFFVFARACIFRKCLGPNRLRYFCTCMIMRRMQRVGAEQFLVFYRNDDGPDFLSSHAAFINGVCFAASVKRATPF
jgi:hypothetical protein